ncbi:Hypothetical protein, putative [Bodo saltans]|uniref:Uncharacterized protein n=1 Tax=Bodo saltans TaxID=75058 RepID=A0A0S4JB77_BODSA|nr:Hypothetical protein, putative [Bodo saltans]|eukprot:CUG87265.1 Hypothetical protein, putative [Bodo saltans]
MTVCRLFAQRISKEKAAATATAEVAKGRGPSAVEGERSIALSIPCSRPRAEAGVRTYESHGVSLPGRRDPHHQQYRYDGASSLSRQKILENAIRGQPISSSYDNKPNTSAPQQLLTSRDMMQLFDARLQVKNGETLLKVRQKRLLWLVMMACKTSPAHQ